MALSHFEKPQSRVIEESIISKLCSLPLEMWTFDSAKTAFLVGDLKKRTYQINLSGGNVVNLMVLMPDKNEKDLAIESNSELSIYGNRLMSRVYAEEERAKHCKLSEINQALEMLQQAIG